MTIGHQISSAMSYAGSKIVGRDEDQARLTVKDNQLVAGRSSRFGRSVAWLHGKVRPGSVRRTNKEAMNLLASKMEATYGQGAGILTLGELGADFRNGRKLTPGKMHAIEVQTKNNLVIRNTPHNKRVIDQFSTRQIGNRGSSIGQAISRHLGEYGFANLDLADTSSRIQQKLADAASKNMVRLTDTQASSIADRVIREQYPPSAVREQNVRRINALAADYEFELDEVPIPNMLQLVNASLVRNPRTVEVMFEFAATSASVQENVSLSPVLATADAFADLNGLGDDVSELLAAVNSCATQATIASRSDDDRLLESGIDKLAAATLEFMDDAAVGRLYGGLTSQAGREYRGVLNVLKDLEGNAGELASLRGEIMDALSNAAATRLIAGEPPPFPIYSSPNEFTHAARELRQSGDLGPRSF